MKNYRVRGERLQNQRNCLEAEQPRVESEASAPREWPGLRASGSFSMAITESVASGEAGTGKMGTGRMMTPQVPSARCTEGISRHQSLFVLDKYASNLETACVSRAVRWSPGPGLRTSQQ